MKKILSLMKSDFKVIRRDSMFFMSILAPFIITILAKIGIPIISNFLMEKYMFNLKDYYVLILSFIIIIIPYILGMVYGLLLLDEKDENVLLYIEVTPLSKNGYIFYKMLSPVILSIILLVFALPFIGIKEVDIFKIIPVITMSAFESPLLAMFIVSFAANKIEGLAYCKGVGIIMLIPFLVYFFPAKWSILLAIFPTYWATEAFFNAFRSGNVFFCYTFVGIVVHALYIYVAYKKLSI